MDKLFRFELTPLNLGVRALVVYVFVLLLIRLSGKRQLAQMSVTEFVAILLISNAVQNSMNGGDNSLAGGLLLSAILIATSTGISYLTYRWQLFRTIFEGTPTLLVHEGKMVHKNLQRERMSESELRSQLRQHGFKNLSELQTVILEADGHLSFQKSEPHL